jgi:hypothetical protein
MAKAASAAKAASLEQRDREQPGEAEARTPKPRARQRKPRARHGAISDWREPDWAPLERLIGEIFASDFMWMYEVRLKDGTPIQAYKHIDTRRYIHLDSKGKAFSYEPESRYRPVEVERVLEEVYRPLAWVMYSGRCKIFPHHIDDVFGLDIDSDFDDG